MRPISNEVVKDIAEKLGAAGFAVCIKGNEEEEKEEENPEEGGDCNIKIALYMNDKLKEVLTTVDVPMVVYTGTYANFYELAIANLDWMKNGMGEGIVLASPAEGPQCVVSKWKIGAEASGDNLSTLESVLQVIDDDKENKFVSAENVAKAKELIGYMLEVNASKLINGEIPKPKVKAPKE